MQYSLKKIFNYIKIKDFAHLLLLLIIFPFAIIAKIFIRDFWLVCEDKNEARDNGYHFFKWVKENKPKQKIAYAINKKSPDYDKIKGIGKVIGFGTIAHWFWYIVADKNISSQKNGKPNAAVCYLFEVIFKARRNNRVFLQHGITINKGDWLYYKNTGFSLFITAAKPEYDFILANFGYPESRVALTGFARFDSLHSAEKDDKLILVMPSWREWLGREGKDNKGLNIKDTDYYKCWNTFLNDTRVSDMLEKYDKKILFFPHRNMQKYLSEFSAASERIEFADWKNYDIQEVLKRAALMITDYSSVFFDFSYMKKPVIFYQFDEEDFRAKQYEKGFFDYHNTVLGQWTGTEDELVSLLEEKFKKGLEGLKEGIIEEFFPFLDAQNCRRIYDKIKNEKQ